jgi:hypothetical protein
LWTVTPISHNLNVSFIRKKQHEEWANRPTSHYFATMHISR